ncbi:MAG: hypothetical protein RL339_2412 [Pseudomonadota bacterium]|jgi:hypothetical protein
MTDLSALTAPAHSAAAAAFLSRAPHGLLIGGGSSALMTTLQFGDFAKFVRTTFHGSRRLLS